MLLNLLEEGIQDRIFTSWDKPDGGYIQFSTLTGRSEWNVEKQERETVIFSEGATPLAKGTVNSRIENGELSAFTREADLHTISLSDFFGKPNQEYAVQAESSRQLKIGSTYLIKTWREQLYLIYVENIAEGTITIDYRKVAGVSGRNYDLHKCARAEALKKNAAQTFETIVYDTHWNHWNTDIELPFVSKYVNGEPEFEGEKIQGSLFTQDNLFDRLQKAEPPTPRLKFITESHLIDIGSKPLAEVTLDDFQKTSKGPSAFLTPRGGRVTDMKKNRTYLAMLFRQESMNYYALRVTEVDAKGRWMHVQARLVGHTPPMEFQKWRSVEETQEIDTNRTITWQFRSTPYGVPSLFRLCRGSEGAQFQIDGLCEGMRHWDFEPHPYASKFGISRVMDPAVESFSSLTEQDALTRLGQYQSTAKVEKGLYIFMEHGYRSRDAYAVEVLSSNANGVEVRIRKILTQRAEMPNSDGPESEIGATRSPSFTKAPSASQISRS